MHTPSPMQLILICLALSTVIITGSYYSKNNKLPLIALPEHCQPCLNIPPELGIYTPSHYGAGYNILNLQ